MVATIGRIDVASIAAPDTGKTLSAAFVRYRLLLAGWQQTAIVVEGPERVLITYAESQPITDADIERSAREALATMFGAIEIDIRVRLSGVFMSTLPAHVQEQTNLRVEVSPPVRAKLGQTSMKIRLWKGDLLVATRLGRFNVLKRHRVAVTTISLQQESIIGAGNVQFAYRFLPNAEDEPTEADIYGRSVRTSVGPGEILSLRDLKQTTATKREIVVKARDNVRVTVTGNGLKLRLNQAEALQSGRIGDVIRVRNLTSKKIITGMVVGAGELEINLGRSR
ncbi:MAG: flagellar basal body P-ring formation protein FlgA [Fuerstiella sp.]|nr:flagellar basal body P-ring formation protein FlgA [Fuerstiella sp.]MCP4859316.1 flagellar basal body P-ring formation protein FlgA [Fuerstiella sp.]